MTPEERRLNLIAKDRELGKTFRGFARRAWDKIEPNPLRWSWHMDAISEHLEAVSKGEIRDLVICVPPGCSKSLMVSTLWPAWDWTRTPTRRFIAASYAQSLSEKNAKLMRDLVNSEWYTQRWPGSVLGKADVAKVREFKNIAGGWRFTTSCGGEVTGRHADVLLGDDLVKAQDAQGRAAIDALAIQKSNEFWFGTMRTRRADAATTAQVMIAQRLHHEDVPGRCIDEGFVALVLPMEYDPARPCKTVVWWKAPGETERTRFEDPRTEKGELLLPERFPLEVVEADKEALGPRVSEAQLQQNPTPLEGAIFKNVGDLRWSPGDVPYGAKTIITVDCAFKDKKSSDFVAIQAWISKGKNYYLMDQIHDRMNLARTMAAILEMKSRWPQAAVHVEDKANGTAVIEMLQGELPGIHEWSPGSNSKESRAESVAHLFAKNVFLPPDDQAPWLPGYMAELAKFPLTKHDDQVDATTMALLILHKPAVQKLLAAYATIAKDPGWR